MFNPTEVPSLAPIIQKAIDEEDIFIVPGKVDDPKGQIYANFTIMSSDFSKMTADEVYLQYLKPATEEIAKRIVAYSGGWPLCTAMAPLPPEGHPMVGFRCIQGKIPVNVYVARRPTPDRHQIIIETRVTRVECECDLCDCFGPGACQQHDRDCPECNDPNRPEDAGMCEWCRDI